MPPNKPKQVLNLDSAYDIHGLLDFILVETVVEKKACGRILTLPYKAVIEPDPEYIDAVLVVEISAYWDAKGRKDERNDEPPRANKIATRH